MKWLPDNNQYRAACENADLRTFKQDPSYAAIVGNDTRGYNTTKAFYEEVKHIPYCSDNDILGNPVLHEIDGKKVSCGTLRYMKVKKDLERWKFNSVVEIGGGYGGQRLVMGDFEHYAIIDLPEPIGLCIKYLSKVGEESRRYGLFSNTGFYSTNYFPGKEYTKLDLCLSDYALCEFDEELMDFYIEKVVKNCKYGYFTVNMNFELLEQKLSQYFSLEIVDEYPKTSKHNNKIYYAENNSLDR